jgi:hypothetical protein
MKTWTVCEKFDAASLDMMIASQMKHGDIAPVSAGTVILSINGTTPWAAAMTQEQMPKAWSAAANGQALDMESVVDKAWPP